MGVNSFVLLYFKKNLIKYVLLDMNSFKALIKEITKCMICLNIANQPNICPKCSAIACEECYKVK